MLPAMPPRQPDLDPAAAYPRITGLRDALDSGDWPACRAVLDASAPVERTELTMVPFAEPGLETFLRGVLDGDPGDGAAAALLGRHLIGTAWRVPTGARAERGAPRRPAGRTDGLVTAERLLVDAAARSPRDPAIWTARLVTARGLRLGRSEAARRYRRLAEIDPHHLPAQWQYLQQLCPEPGGDWEPAHAFARETAEAAPPGSFGPVLVAEAHLEHWNREHHRQPGAGRRYLADDRVRAGLHEAARRSVWHADFRHTHGWVRVTSTFAMAFALLDDRPAADSLFTTLGDLGSDHPWYHLGDPGAVIVKYRKRVAGGGT
ncbi:hypothetical protein BC793_115218 [Actinoplanes xinjiangensis]|uniref:DUF4034 domain-containing protein n=2 Tax=Actinoplanes xinjiangensis TaxID=512350 RepID=A0A316FRT5_9ACTN|nr:hypothetical protein BC793_115218 [Actinoplanes xinjiangensis]GIF41263.1 hypothetical protein Axi01nite_55740 [Actinoplanes xinjiangensis]